MKNSWGLSRKKVYYCAAIVAIGLCVVGAYVMWKNHSQPTEPAAKNVMVVRSQVVEAANKQQSFSYAGEVRGRYESHQAFLVGGKIIRRDVQLGSVVHAGDILMQVDSRDIQQNVNSISAMVSSAQSQLRLAETNLNRFRNLYAQKAISRAQLEQYENAYEVARAGVMQASAQQAQGSNQLDYSVLCAEKSGVVSSINAEVGQVVGAGMPVVTIIEDGEREIEISVPENRIDELRKAQKISVNFWALPKVSLTGTIREVAPMADPIARTYKVRVSVGNPPPEVKLGMTASVTIFATAEQSEVGAVSVPLSAIYQKGTEPCVWVIENNTVILRQVTVGSYGKEKIDVLSGLKPGEVIVTAGVHTLQERQEVKLMDGDGR